MSQHIHDVDSSLVTPRQKRHSFKIEGADGHDIVRNPMQRTSTQLIQGMSGHDFKPAPRTATMNTAVCKASPDSKPPAGARRTPALQYVFSRFETGFMSFFSMNRFNFSACVSN